MLGRLGFVGASVCALGVMCGGAASAEPTILTVAPEDAWLVIHVPDASRVFDAEDETALARLLGDEDIRGFLMARFADVRDSFEERARAIDMEIEELPRPTGAVGMAFVDARGDEVAGAEGAPWPPEPSVVVWADFGEDADEAEETIERLLDEAIEDGRMTFEEAFVGDIEVVTVTEVLKEEADAPEWMDETDRTPATISFARVGTAMLASDDVAMAIAAVEAALGEARGGVVGDAPDMREALAAHPGGAAGYAVMRMPPVRAGWVAMCMEALDTDGREIAEALGLRSVRSFSASLDMDTADAAVEMRVTVLMDEKSGAFGLMSRNYESFDPPAFVGAEVAAVTHGRVSLSEVLPLADRVLSRFPQEFQEQARFGLEQTRALAGPLLGAIGPDYWQWTRYRRPLEEGSEEQVFALRVSDERVVVNSLGLLAGFASATPREFEGVQLFDGGQIGISAAVAGGWVFAGSTAMVEDAIRANARAGGDAGLGGEAWFRRARGAAGGPAVAGGFVKTADAVEWIYFSARREAERAREFAEEFEMSDEQREMFLSRTQWVEELPPMESFTDVIGDVVWRVEATARGYEGRSVWLRPAD